VTGEILTDLGDDFALCFFRKLTPQAAKNFCRATMTIWLNALDIAALLICSDEASTLSPVICRAGTGQSLDSSNMTTAFVIRTAR
jgi:hypothetical protein